jgi:hypothetical protein
MPADRKTWCAFGRSGAIAIGVLVAAVSAAAAQTDYRPRDQQRTIDELRTQRQQSDQRLGDDLVRQRQLQEQRSQQQQYEDQLRRQRLQDQLDRQQRR